MIKNYETYNERMSKSLFDKAFFIDKIHGAEVVVDFGCADGSLIRYLNKINPDLTYIGYDNDSTMLEAASTKTNFPNVVFSKSLDEIEKLVRGKKWAINFSSVLHEVEQTFMPQLRIFLNKTKPAYICVRDMNCTYTNLSSDAMRKIEKEPLWEDYTKDHIIFPVTYIEYLLKRSYTENWEKEKKENYFSAFPKFQWLYLGGYKTIWDVCYCLPYQKLQWNKDLGFDYEKEKFTTHRQLIITNQFTSPF